MTDADIMPDLTAWHAAMVNMDAQYDALNALVGLSPESPFPDAINRLQSLATDMTAKAVGDDGAWLNYYWLECQMGKGMFSGGHGMAIIDGKEYPIRTLKQLARVIVAYAKPEAGKP